MQLEKDQPEVSVMGDDHQYTACLQADNGEPSFELYANKIGVQLKVWATRAAARWGV
jgi:hypothetical protein